MKTLIVILTTVASCWAGGLEFGGHGLTLGEVSLDHDGGSIGWDESGSEQEIEHGGYGGHFSHVIKHIGVPVVKHVPFPVHKLEIEKVPQNYQVPVFVKKEVPYEVEKQVFTKVEKKVPTPIEKIIPVQVEKKVPFTVVKHIPVPVVKHIPIKIPIYKTVIHRHKGHY
ncbi:uncharacterized protein LOC113464457 [Ceratina calcarata]|uniref:Uncharacterized protein LOC113464457 n=1 Tax=Ceratina calcarata TaxID=156304 RepID=A0AAJ7WBC6_9HYME|nr:uncharacterized protein LOC113464457 [Ceratina calcarata]